MTKKELRVLYKSRRKQVDPHQAEKLNDLILIQFQKIKLPFIGCVHTYLASLRLNEPDTSSIIRYLHFREPQLKVAVPRIDLSTNDMHHIHMDDNVNLLTNNYGIDEPETGDHVEINEIGLVLVPLLAFDAAGFRVGYGKGFYDRFLKKCRPDTIKVGISFFDEPQEIDDIDVFDVPLDYCATPSRLFTF